jgi:uncharacterized Fe-S cluster-containing radical SAM superfamily protein
MSGEGFKKGLVNRLGATTTMILRVSIRHQHSSNSSQILCHKAGNFFPQITATDQLTAQVHRTLHKGPISSKSASQNKETMFDHAAKLMLFYSAFADLANFGS